MDRCLQETFAPHNACFGCGPANPHGLRIKSYVKGENVIASWTPEPHHEAFPGVLNGGIIGAILDCHANWTAAWSLMQATRANTPPCTVTSEYNIRLLRPTPTDKPVFLSAKLVAIQGDKATVEATLTAHEKLCATCKGVFVAVKPGHPAYHRW